MTDASLRGLTLEVPLRIQDLTPGQRSLVELMHRHQFSRIENMPYSSRPVARLGSGSAHSHVIGGWGCELKKQIREELVRLSKGTVVRLEFHFCSKPLRNNRFSSALCRDYAVRQLSYPRLRSSYSSLSLGDYSEDNLLTIMRIRGGRENQAKLASQVATSSIPESSSQPPGHQAVIDPRFGTRLPAWRRKRYVATLALQPTPALASL
jgi:hypothetical protein